MTVLVTGGARSGKSLHAESLLVAEPHVTYIAPRPTIELDDERAAQAAVQQARRPSHWTTLESADLASAVRQAEGAVLIDCLATWLGATLSELDGWESLREDWEPVLFERLDDALAAIAQHHAPVVVVTNEAGMGVVPDQRAGRLFRDLLGAVNQHVAAECDEVALVVAGRVLSL
ncbi:bifunctional adenosylcobinamide kinase/adenosylcobinamide-phosphate guanylyltransferase [Aeromicrobium wangtongii]|uniref:bifunctional adenosylcobinamide kinase/adenosylcobinamide-phosphate guanylyltransferase n=1 Tax=Aeromicrobium wangtongii TaxID=2969247 RepID=UPI002016E1F8|nr:bifunctional adenosylcobinamide kinase/adenosylcobinamide-phosphate guanylyltransferase [Aeromicrobium wangtongii]MCL3819307.1 bifunctional adenosylcobinamide kinase/adenosylcobinamide-phosphate guanylyltransferase [Aeromicrobium wangtongii]